MLNALTRLRSSNSFLVSDFALLRLALLARLPIALCGIAFLLPSFYDFSLQLVNITLLSTIKFPALSTVIDWTLSGLIFFILCSLNCIRFCGISLHFPAIQTQGFSAPFLLTQESPSDQLS